MNYEIFGPERLEAVRAIYEEAGWYAYLGNDEALHRAFEQSLYVLGAFEGDELIGFVRCVGDGEHVVIVQDLIVRKARRRQGIGRMLLQYAMERYGHVRMLALFTDMEDEAANRFYQKMGLRRAEQMRCAAYMR